MRILLITQWFDPEPVAKGLSFAKALEDCGYGVQVLTGFPNYPTGKLYEGYKLKFYHKENLNGVDIIRVPLYPSHDTSVLGRISNYLSFAVSAAVLGPWLTKRPDLIYVYHPPPTSYLPAFALKRFYRVPVVYDIQDFWPDTLSATGMFNNKTGLRIVDAYCRTFYKVASKIVVLSPGFSRKLKEKGVPQEKTEIIYNWFDENNLTAEETNGNLPEVLTRKDNFKILFAGNMGKAQALETVLEAAKQLKDTNPLIQFAFIGGGVEVDALRTQASQMELTNVHFLDPVPPAEVGPILNAADVLLVHLKKDPLFEITIPSKIQAYLAAGKPILVAVPGDASDLINDAKAGLGCPSEDPDQLAETARAFSKMSPSQLTEMGERGKDFYDNHMCMQVGIDRFNILFNELINQTKKR